EQLMTRAPVGVGAAIALLSAVALTGCSTEAGASSDGKPAVVAAENFWGSIASQLGGNWVTVTSIIKSPNADPHDYEPTAAHPRLMASADFVIENGIGYD